MNVLAVSSFIALAIVESGTAAKCQSVAPAPSILVVRTRTPDGRPLPGVDLAIVKNDSEVVAFAQSNAGGMTAIPVALDGANYGLIARKIAYAAATYRLPASRDTIRIEISLIPVAGDTVRIVERELPLSKRPYLGAEEIANSSRAIFTLADALRKLRPDITYQGNKCPTSKARLITSARMRIIGPGNPVIVKPRVYANGQFIRDDFHPTETIRAEHIAAVRYVNCLDESVPGLAPKPWPSIYISLKPGVVWDFKNGSHVVDSAQFVRSQPRPY